MDLFEVYTVHKALADAKGLKLIVYEGGNFMELDGAGEDVVERFFEVNRDSRLAALFVENIENFLDAGGQEFFYFLNEDLWGDEGAFGARRYQDQTRDDAPVFDGLMDYIESSKCSWDSCEMPAP